MRGSGRSTKTDFSKRHYANQALVGIKNRQPWHPVLGHNFCNIIGRICVPAIEDFGTHNLLRRCFGGDLFSRHTTQGNIAIRNYAQQSVILRDENAVALKLQHPPGHFVKKCARRYDYHGFAHDIRDQYVTILFAVPLFWFFFKRRKTNHCGIRKQCGACAKHIRVA